MTACVNAGSRTDKARRIRWINVGTSGGQTANISPVALRTSRLEIIGSGLGSEPDSELLTSVAEAFAAAHQAGFKVNTWTASVEDAETAWTASKSDKRQVPRCSGQVRQSRDRTGQKTVQEQETSGINSRTAWTAKHRACPVALCVDMNEVNSCRCARRSASLSSPMPPP